MPSSFTLLEYLSTNGTNKEEGRTVFNGSSMIIAAALVHTEGVYLSYNHGDIQSTSSSRGTSAWSTPKCTISCGAAARYQRPSIIFLLACGTLLGFCGSSNSTI